MIVDAQAAAGIDGLERDALAPELPHQLAHSLNGRAKWGRGANLRTDVDADAMRLEPAVARRALVDGGRAADVDAELVLAQAGGDIGMRIGEDIGVDTQRKAGADFEPARAGGQQRELRLAFHVELENSRVQRQVNLRGRLAHTGEDNPARRFRRGGQYALQFAAGDDVESRAAIGKQLENRQRGVGFHRVTDQMIPPGKGLLEQPQPRGNLAGRINVERRAEAAGQGLQRDAIAMQRGAGPRMVKRARRSLLNHRSSPKPEECYIEATASRCVHSPLSNQSAS